MPVTTGHRCFQHLKVRINTTPKCVGGAALPVGSFSKPGRDCVPNQWALFVEQDCMYMLIVAEIAKIIAQLVRAAGLIGVDRVRERFGLGQFNRRNLPCGPHGQSDQNSHDDEQGGCQPERQKDFEKQTSHRVPFLPLGRASAKMYPAPRMVLMCSSESESPSFFRTLLTCMSILRSNGENFRPRTSSTRASRVTTRPASRSSTCSNPNSTDVSSTGLPRWCTVRVAG